MANPIRFIVLTATLMAVGPALHAQQITLRAGTLIHCTLYEPKFSSRTAQIGEPVICHTYPLREFGYSVFPRGSYLTGRFVDYKDPGRFVGKGWLKLEFDRCACHPAPHTSSTARHQVKSADQVGNPRALDRFRRYAFLERTSHIFRPAYEVLLP